jgi:hypothetical protein
VTDPIGEFAGTSNQDPTVIDISNAVDRRAEVIVRFNGKTAMLHLLGIASGAPDEHLCIDVHAFVDGNQARVGVFGMEAGRRHDAFADTAPGTSHGWPATRMVAVLIGRQNDTPPTDQSPAA